MKIINTRCIFNQRLLIKIIVMPIYHRMGSIPSKRHTQFRQENNQLYHEQLFGTIGFEGMSTLSYHVYPPTQVVEVHGSVDVKPIAAIDKNIKSLKLISYNIEQQQDWISARVPLLFNGDCIIGCASISSHKMDYFYKNADADELLFIHEGSGVLSTMLGNIHFSPGDYLVIPRGLIYKIEFKEDSNRVFYTESYHPLYTPKKYRNWFGQLQEHAPYCERDYLLPTELETHDEKGAFMIKVKKEHTIHALEYASHPFDVVGWDGYNYPYGISIHNFEPITGRVHQPPPVHQMFETSAFVVCSFCPRLYDYHPQAIPAPYNHSNIDSDEVIYYVDGDFMSRNDVDRGHITLHPGGIPHGPHPGAYERSIGKKETEELAVMVDTFRPLKVTEQALAIDDGKYYQSWLKPH